MSGAPQTQRWSLWPLLYFDPKWGGAAYDCFDLGVRLVRADRDFLKAMERIVGNGYRGQFDFEQDVKWLLAVPVGDEYDYADHVRLGFSTREKVAEAVANTFLLCLRLVRQTGAVCPVWFDGAVGAQAPCGGFDARGSTDYEDPSLDWDRANVTWEEEEPFEESDLVKVVEVWDRLVDCLSLKNLLERAREEAFWQAIDREATHQAFEPIQRHVASRHLTQEHASIVQSVPFYQERHAAAFRFAFSAHMDKTFLRATRFGRALGLFSAGFASEAMGAFVWTCFALETLFTVEKRTNRRRITEKLRTRIVKVGFPEAQGTEMEKLKTSVNRLLKERGDVVHGSKGIGGVPEEFQKAATTFARRCLRAILARPRLLAMYCDHCTGTDGTIREDVSRLRGYFNELDNGVDPLDERG